MSFRFSIYTDGSCKNNPGPGGWAAIIIKQQAAMLDYDDKQELTISGCSSFTTNNRMELTSVIKSISYTPSRSIIDLYSDSRYVIDGSSIYIYRWLKNNWKNKKNTDLWQKLYYLIASRSIKWHWIKGHSNNLYNSRVDYLARIAIDKF